MPACPETETTMPTQTITLTKDQADDLRELLSYAEILEDWLLHAPDDTLDELARFAYHDHFHPYSATWWLVEDLGHLRCRLRKTLTGHHHEQDEPAADPRAKTIEQAQTSPAASSRDRLDTAASIGNQIRPPRPGSSRPSAILQMTAGGQTGGHCLTRIWLGS
jgi:hypothetical protein